MYFCSLKTHAMKHPYRLLPLLLVIASVIVAIVPCQARTKKLSTAIDSLDMALKEARTASEARNALIDSLLGHGDTASIGRLMELGNAFSGIKNDSAIVFYGRAYHKATAINDSVSAKTAIINMAGRFSNATMFNEALNALRSVDPQSLDYNTKKLYYSTLAKTHIERHRYHPLSYIAKTSLRESLQAIDSLIPLLPETSPGYNIAVAQKHLIQGDSILAAGELLEALETTVPNSTLSAHATRMLADIYKDNPTATEEYAYYLALTARANALNADYENRALLELGSELFKTGDLKRAYDYMQEAGKQIYDSDSRNLYVSLVPTMSEMIIASQAKESYLQSVHLIIYIIGLAIIIFLTVMLWRCHVSRDLQTKANIKLSQSLLAKDQYIERLLGLCSVYVDGIEDFSRLVIRKIKANQSKDLLEHIESGKLLRDQSEKFFEVFDNAIFNIYPDFIAEINTLLLPDKQLSLPEQGSLTPEMRIAAFMRMGVNDSGKLSKFLGLSLNTIYTYRNRMKNRAINREGFEEALIKLGQRP